MVVFFDSMTVLNDTKAESMKGYADLQEITQTLKMQQQAHAMAEMDLQQCKMQFEVLVA